MSDKHGNVVSLRPMQFVSPPPDPKPPAPRIPPEPYLSFDEMDIVTLRDYIRAMDLLHGYLPTIIHKDPAVSLCNGTMKPIDVAQWEWEHIKKKRGKMTDGKLRQWVRGHTPELLAIVGEGVDQIISPTDVEVKEIDNVTTGIEKAPNLFSMLGRNRAAAATPTPDPAPAPAAAPAQSVPTLTIPAKAEPAKAEPAKDQPAKQEPTTVTMVDIRQHPHWNTVASLAKGLGIDLEGFISSQEALYGATVATLEDRDNRLRYLHTNLPKFIEAVFNQPELPNI